MKNILYIGNNLSTQKSNVSSIQTLGNLLESEGYNLRYSSSFHNKFLRFIDMIWCCMKYARWADVVLIDTYSTQNFYFALVCSQLSRLFKVPYYPILHGGNLPERLELNPTLSGLVFNNSKQNISPSLYLKEVFNKMGYDNITYIPNSILLNQYQVEPKSFETIRLLWVRSFSKIYNPELAIRVAKQLHGLNYGVELCMVGPDAEELLTSLKSLASELDVNIKFTGKLTKIEWINLSYNYNIFINTTNFDNMPVSVIEAMALGFPVISTNVGGIPFLIDDKKNGLLVPPNSVEKFTNAIVDVIENEDLRQKLSNNARIKAESFEWSLIKSRWNSILKTK